MKVIKVSLNSPKELRDLLLEAERAALDFLNTKESSKVSFESILNSLSEVLHFERDTNLIYAFDNTHFSGKNCIGCVIAWQNGDFNKSLYRRYSFDNNTDEYAMMRHVVRSHLLSIKVGKIPVPDFLIIDGGDAHKALAIEIMSKINFYIPFVCLAKGRDRNSRNETIFSHKDDKGFKLQKDSNELLFLEMVRNEVHRFALYCNKLKSNQIVSSSVGF